MIIKPVRAFKTYWFKVLIHISGQNCTLCFFVCQQNFKTLLYVVLEKIEFKVYIENYTYNQIKLSTHHYLRFIQK